MILDTSFLIDIMDGDEAALAWATIIEDRDVVQRVPVPVVYELYVGVGYSETRETEKTKIQRVLDARPVVETTKHIAKSAGRLDGQLRRDGNRVSKIDVIIGATARHFDEPVVTGNPGDFEQIPGVEVSTYGDE